MKPRKPPARRTVHAAAQVCITLLLAGCATAIQAPAPSSEEAGQPPQQATANAPATPPGQRLEKFILCYEMRRPQASPAEKPVKRFSIEVNLLVPQDDCLALDANGWLRVVPGQCRRAPAPGACEEK